MEKGDSLICRIEKKNFLMRCTAVASGTIHGFLERDFHIPRKRMAVEVTPKNVLINLGKSPMPGKVYGVDIQRSLTTKEHDEFGSITFFYKPQADVLEAIKTGMRITHKLWRKQGLADVIGQPECVWEIYAEHGSMAGCYKRSKKPDVNPHRLQLFMKAVPMSEIPYVLSHELAHHLHWEYLTGPSLNSAWIKLFNTSIKPASVTKDKSLGLLKAMLNHDGPPSTVASMLSDEEDSRAFRWILRTIQHYRGVGVKELDLLHETNNIDEIEMLWPKRSIPIKELAPVVSAYATKNYKELFAEAISFHMVGKTLPKEVQTLVDKSLTYARKQLGK